MLYAVLSRQGDRQCRIGYTTEQDPEENTTAIHLKTVEMNDRAASGNYWITGSLSIGGKKVWGYDSWYAQVYLGTGWNRASSCPGGAPTIYARHEPDGSCSIRFSAQFTFVRTGISFDYSASATVALPAMPKASTVEAGSITLGQPTMLRIIREAEDLTTGIRWQCGGDSGILAEKTESDTVEWTPDISLAAWETEKDTVDVTLTVSTWAGDTEIGSRELVIPCRIPEFLCPTAAISVTDLTGCKTQYGAFVELRSQVQVLTDAQGILGSRITRIQVWCGHLNSTGADTRFRISGSGQIPITAVVTDSRGRTAEASTEIRVIPCRRPEITIRQVQRCTADGTLQPEGDHALVTFTASVSPVEDQNSAAFFLQRRSGDGYWLETPIGQYSGSYEIEEGQVIFPAGVNEAYLVRLLARDDFETVPSLEERLGAAFAMLDFDRNQLGIGIGQRAGAANTVSLGLDMQMNTHRITGLPAPEEDTDAANKQYVDGLLEALARQLGIQLEVT